MKKKLLFLLTFVLLLACVFTACNHEDDLFGGMLPEDGADGPADNTQTPPPNQGEQEEGEEEENFSGPYMISYQSNGDGTCSVVRVQISKKAEPGISVVIPETSPDGETVTAIRSTGLGYKSYDFPIVMEATVWETCVMEPLMNKIDEMEATYGSGSDECEEMYDALTRIESWFVCYDPTALEHYSGLREDLPEVCHYIEQTGKALYVLDETFGITDSEKQILQNCFDEHINYSSTSAKRNEISATVRELGRLYPDSRYAEAARLYTYPRNCPEKVVSVSVPASITVCEENFSRCANLKSAVQPGHIRALARSIESVEILPGTQTIAEEAFAVCSLTSVTIPEGVTEIKAYAFYECPLSSVTLPSSLLTIEEGAFFCYATEFNYSGTVEQFWLISREGWINTPHFNVHCSDGTISQ